MAKARAEVASPVAVATGLAARARATEGGRDRGAVVAQVAQARVMEGGRDWGAVVATATERGETVDRVVVAAEGMGAVEDGGVVGAVVDVEGMAAARTAWAAEGVPVEVKTSAGSTGRRTGTSRIARHTSARGG